MISEKVSPLRRGGSRFRRPHCLNEWSRIAAGERIKKMLVDLEVENHMQPLTSGAEIFHVGTWKHVRFRQTDCFSFSPSQELAEGRQHIVLLFSFGDIRALLRNDKWNSVHAKAGDSKL